MKMEVILPFSASFASQSQYSSRSLLFDISSGSFHWPIAVCEPVHAASKKFSCIIFLGAVESVILRICDFELCAVEESLVQEAMKVMLRFLFDPEDTDIIFLMSRDQCARDLPRIPPLFAYQRYSACSRQIDSVRHS